MNILFLTMSGNLKSLDCPGLYADLLRQFVEAGHKVYAVAPGSRTEVICGEGWKLLKVKTDNGKGNLIKKGIGQILLCSQFQQAIRTHFRELVPERILYTTPPITLAPLIARLKKKHSAATYLLLKDIFPQNAVDLGMMRKTGVKGLIYRYFRGMEKKLYAISDRIGCMSVANAEYVLRHNPEIDPKRVEVCPNSIQVRDMSVSAEVRAELRAKYEIPQDKKVFVYGGNLGKPQGIPFLMRCLENEKNNCGAYLLIVGDGTEYKKLEAWFAENKPANAKLLKRLPKEDYDRLVAACDVGLIFLDHRFTIPNFPSRLLSYMQAKLPVLCCTDPNTDIGKVCQAGGFGWGCESNDPAAFGELVQKALSSDLQAMGEVGYTYLNEHYTVQKGCGILLSGLFGEEMICETSKA